MQSHLFASWCYKLLKIYSADDPHIYSNTLILTIHPALKPYLISQITFQSLETACYQNVSTHLLGTSNSVFK